MWIPISNKNQSNASSSWRQRFQDFVRLEEAQHGEFGSLCPGTLARDRAVDQILGGNTAWLKIGRPEKRLIDHHLPHRLAIEHGYRRPISAHFQTQSNAEIIEARILLCLVLGCCFISSPTWLSLGFWSHVTTSSGGVETHRRLDLDRFGARALKHDFLDVYLYIYTYVELDRDARAFFGR